MKLVPQLGFLAMLLLPANIRADAATSNIPLSVYPSGISLTDSRDTQHLIVLVKRVDGSTQDVTQQAEIAVSDAGIVTYDEQTRMIHPIADGETQLSIRFGDQEATVSVSVSNHDAIPELSFQTDVLAVLTKAGCNTGKCHGSASGKDGFRLSLFGYDPAGDHYRLTREIPGRRINVASPENCLFINKALGNFDHTGGGQIAEDTPEYETLIAWLKSGAPADPPGIPVPTGIRVFPEEVVFSNRGESQPLMVMASFSDGSDRDVTDRAVFISNNDAAASAAKDGRVSSNGRGSAFIMARFDQFTEGSAIIVRPGTPFSAPDFPKNNDIDELVAARWNALHLLPSDLCSDEVFLRRAYLDLIGLLPTSEERTEFLADNDADKRAKLVDNLLDRLEFSGMWVMKWQHFGCHSRTRSEGSIRL